MSILAPEAYFQRIGVQHITLVKRVELNFFGATELKKINLKMLRPYLIIPKVAI